MVSLRRLFLKTLGQIIPSDVFAHRFPVSVKGICFIDGKVILLRNERDEWDLPGGKLKKKEDVQHCLVREIEEELSILVQPHHLLCALKMDVMDTIEIFVIVYSCLTQATIEELKISEESFELGVFNPAELDGISLSPMYKDAIKQAFHEHV